MSTATAEQQIDPNAHESEGVVRPRSVSKVLRQVEHVTELVKKSAEDLSAVAMALKQELANPNPPFGVADALEDSEAVKRRLDEAFEMLVAVNHALEGEVRNGVLLSHQFAAVTEQEQAARHAAIHDALTGLPNRALFDDRLEHGIAQASRHEWGLAVMFLDLDNFKRINDSHGHGVGDVVLKTVAQRLKASHRKEDTVGRLGGDEFVYLLMGLRDEKTIAMIAEKIIDALQAPIRIQVRDLAIDVSITASIGIAISPKDGVTADALVSKADTAMYQAKRRKAGYSFAQ